MAWRPRNLQFSGCCQTWLGEAQIGGVQGLRGSKEEYDHNESGVRAGPVSNGDGGVWPNEPRVRKGAGGQRKDGRRR